MCHIKQKMTMWKWRAFRPTDRKHTKEAGNRIAATTCGQKPKTIEWKLQF